MRKRENGLSLIEILLTLGLLTVLMSLSSIDWQTAIERRQGEAILKKITSALQAARTEAIKSGSTITVCRSANASSCGGQWHDGLIVFSDLNRNRIIDQSDEMILAERFENLAGTIKWRAFRNRQYLQVNAQGVIQFQSGNFTFCPASGHPANIRQLIISSTGRIRVAIDRDGDGRRENASGQAIEC
ncbi:MAG: GspH/FimT family pseudopilin [Pseudomonadales bacterium]|nr:GspH/FimT family pseudopilin [Pseudomonadales bacterium]